MKRNYGSENAVVLVRERKSKNYTKSKAIKSKLIEES